MTDQAPRTPEEELAHWRGQLAKALKANPELPWKNLIEWAEEAEEWAIKAATRSGRANLAGLGKQLDDANQQIKVLIEQRNQAHADIDVYRREVFKLQDELETAAYDRTWPADRERPADVQREVAKAVAAERQHTETIANQYKAAQARWQTHRDQMASTITESLKADWSRARSRALQEAWEALRDTEDGPLIDAMRILNALMNKQYGAAK
ncbi:hypothetical protein GPZ77_34415 (plasmid) [Streptomyces sp. QHH-9511]|uniref:hypothetical protein n=1 Tax=Streptomyces sp. QHH-9511 TaxID=2684468 RepID=UPI0013179B30|nr:hypothetical protein [Streptomyces sp. QHH-9511]QGZ53326.1 hypothetical protein GPZ77_34415 [Streptomyces sp. QHH-9511]